MPARFAEPTLAPVTVNAFRSPIVDAHSDLLLELDYAEQQLGETNPLASRWLPPLQSGGVTLQVCAIYIEPDLSPADGLRELLRQVRCFHANVEANGDSVFAVRSAADLDAVGGGRIGLLLALEGASSLGTDAWLIDIVARLGLRMASLTWNDRNAFAGGCGHDEGLTELGRRLVDRMVELGVVVDLAHASPRTVDDVLDRVSDTAVLVSHAACRALRDHPRNLSDRQLAALAERRGVLGLMPHPLTVDPASPTLDRFLDHVDHAVATMGVAHVGLGGDFLRQIAHARGEEGVSPAGVPFDAALDGLEGPEDYPALVSALRERGYADEELAALMGGNLLRLLRDELPQTA
jgi:membrane dipeptidase